MNPWLETALAKADSVSQADCLASLRQASLAELKNTAWPTRKTEAWKYTSLKTLEKLQLGSGANSTPELQDSHANFPAIESIQLQWQSGVLLTDIGQLPLPQGLTIKTISNLNDIESKWIGNEFASVKPAQHVFGLVNDVLAQDIVVIDVAAGADITVPVHIAHTAVAGKEGHCRVFVRVADNAKLSVLETYQSLQGASETDHSFNTNVVEYKLGVSAQLEHYRFDLQTGKALSVGGCHVALSEKAQLNSTFVGLGSELARTDFDMIHSGEYADAKLNAIYLLKDDERFDLHATVEHAVPNCTTLENVRGIAADQGQATFNGRIHIHRDAQKTLAELNNRNLLLSDKAQINTKPELEIYADDVRCAHGATVAELDSQALYYLTSRGVSREDALVMLNFGFINALVDEMPNQDIAQWLRPLLRERFAEMAK